MVTSHSSTVQTACQLTKSYVWDSSLGQCDVHVGSQGCAYASKHIKPPAVTFETLNCFLVSAGACFPARQHACVDRCDDTWAELNAVKDALRWNQFSEGNKGGEEERENKEERGENKRRGLILVLGT